MKWFKENCKQVALTLENRAEFEKKYRGAYMSARKNGWLDEICEHMIPKNKNWSKYDCEIECSKYSNRSLLSRVNPTVYKKVIKNGWHYMFLHMDNSYVNDDRCIYVYEFDTNCA